VTGPPFRSPNVPDPDDPTSRDPQGRMALFSSTEPEPEAPHGGLLIECSSCLTETRVSAFDVAMAALPLSLHLPFVRRYHSFLRCPACGRRAWVRLSFRP
jgi:uncharacterized protein with PIN domain